MPGTHTAEPLRIIFTSRGRPHGPHHLVTARLSPGEHDVSLTAGADDRAGSATVTIQVVEP